MSKFAGIKGSVTIKVGDAVTVKDFTLPLDVSAAYDKGTSSAKLTVDSASFKASLEKLKDWIAAFPDELTNG